MLTPSLGLRSCGLSDLEEDEEEAVSMSFPEWQAGGGERRRGRGRRGGGVGEIEEDEE